MAYSFKTTKKGIIMTEENEETYRNYNSSRFCDKEIISDKVRDQCHLTGKNRCPAYSKCNISSIQKQSNFIPFILNNFSKNDCHLFFESWLIKRMLK